MTFLVWMSDNDLIDYSSYLVIVEDIIDTFPIKDLEKVFIILEKNLNTKTYVILKLIFSQILQIIEN